MVALAFLLRTASAIWNTLGRSLRNAFVAICESQMHRAQMEIDRYHRINARFDSTGHVRN